MDQWVIRRRRRKGFGSSFSDLSLMTSGGFLLHLNDTTTLFTDSSGTTPVSADGDYVNYATDISGTSGYMYQTNGNTAAPNWNATEQACYFDGGADAGRDFLFNNNSLLIPKIAGGTMAARVRQDVGSTGFRAIMATLESTTQRFYLALLDGVAAGGCGDQSTATVIDPSATDLRSATVFHTLALTWDATTWQLYLDGAQINSGSHAGSDTTFYLPLGTEDYGPYGYDFAGSMKYAMFEGHHCSASDMLNLHNLWSA